MVLPPEIDRFSVNLPSIFRYTYQVEVADHDMRRSIVVTLPNANGFETPDDDPEFENVRTRVADALAMCYDNLPPDAVAIKLDGAGKLLSVSTNPDRNVAKGTDYLELDEYQLPPAVAGKTVLRSELTELRRLGAADLVSYPPRLCPSASGDDKKCYVFKYATDSTVSMWTEIQMLARLPPHPHMALLDRLVLDEVTRSQVVGFTMRYVAGGTLKRSRPRFKLRWLRQLMQTVDDLNLKHGIIHQDIAHRNLLIDADTDSIVLIDFDVACRVGIVKNGGRDTEGKWGERDDVKGVLLFLYEYITRDPALGGVYFLHLLDEKDYKDPAKWAKHPDVELDDDVGEFYFELMAWVRKRRAGTQMTHHTEAPEPLGWPELRQSARKHGLTFMVGERQRYGVPYLEWRRPAESKMDPTRRLLATGRYADEEEAAQNVAAERLASFKAREAAYKAKEAAKAPGSPTLEPLSIIPRPWYMRDEIGEQARRNRQIDLDSDSELASPLASDASSPTDSTRLTSSAPHATASSPRPDGATAAAERVDSKRRSKRIDKPNGRKCAPALAPGSASASASETASNGPPGKLRPPQAKPPKRKLAVAADGPDKRRMSHRLSSPALSERK